jgi:hypothetical protein
VFLSNIHLDICFSRLLAGASQVAAQTGLPLADSHRLIELTGWLHLSLSREKREGSKAEE